MMARLLLDRRVAISESAFVELVLWAVPESVRGSVHHYKYRLALVARGVCVLRYDNEAGKGDHRHVGEVETAYVFVDVDRLIADFWTDVARWRHDNPDA